MQQRFGFCREARELAWDVERQGLAPLEPLLRLRLHNEASV